MSDNSNNNGRVKAEIKIESKEKFIAPSKTDYKSATTLAASINSVFNEVFTDYNGCFVEPGNRAKGEPSTILTLDFIPGYDNQHGGAFKAFKLIGETSNNGVRKNGSVATAIAQHNQIIKAKESYEITQDAVDILYNLLWTEVQMQVKDTPKSFSSKGVFIETVDNPTQGYGYITQKQVIHETITCVDIVKVMSMILPKKDEEDGSPLFYEITPSRPLPSNSMYNSTSINYLYAITQYNKNAMDNIIQEYGYNVGAYASRVITS